jgi:EAL domain-containing protein (putative c-di-GMP-specific phosphodiesterase class I)
VSWPKSEVPGKSHVHSACPAHAANSLVMAQTPPFSCNGCKDGIEQPFPFSMAFQPIVDVDTGKAFAYEALVRGERGESAGSILGQVTKANRYAFDQRCRVKAISLAAQLGLSDTGAQLSINFMPGAVYSPAACIQLTLATAREVGFPCDQIIFEITEAEEVVDRAHIRANVEDYRQRGFKVALDDVGAGYCGLNLLADFPTDIIKLDMDLTRNLPQRPTALAIVKLMVELARTLGSQLIAEGIETVDEYNALRRCGIHLMQGFLFAKPAFQALPSFTLPNVRLDAIGAGEDNRISTPVAVDPSGAAVKMPGIPLH